MDNVQKTNDGINIPSSQTFRSYPCIRLKYDGYYMYHLFQHLNNSAFCPQSAFMGTVWFSGITGIISLSSINHFLCNGDAVKYKLNF
jgi:hypothetical protein